MSKFEECEYILISKLHNAKFFYKKFVIYKVISVKARGIASNSITKSSIQFVFELKLFK